MTAFALDEERERCLDSGMNDFSPPIDPETVVATLAEIAARIERAPQAGMAAATAAPATPAATADFPSPPGIDSAEGPEAHDEQAGLYQKMLKSFHDRFIDAPATIRASPAAGRIEDARREAHSAKGVSASVSANHLRDQALLLEKAIAAGQADVEAEIVAFGIALDVVLAGLRAQFGWTAAQ